MDGRISGQIGGQLIDRALTWAVSGLAMDRWGGEQEAECVFLPGVACDPGREPSPLVHRGGSTQASCTHMPAPVREGDIRQAGG